MFERFSPDESACRRRQARLRSVLAAQGLDLAIVMDAAHVQWLCGVHIPRQFCAAAALLGDGSLVVVLPEGLPQPPVADVVLRYAAQWHCTLRNDQRRASSECLGDWLKGALPQRPLRLGVEYSAFCRHLTQLPIAAMVDIEPDLYRLRRRKDADELALMRHAIGATERMYEHAREILRPGLSELAMFNALQSVAVEALGEMLTATGNDYQCASPAGPPRQGRTAQPGELYILDLGPAFRGYFADNCRTLAVTTADELQQEAWSRVVEVFPLIEQEVRPGVSARQLFQRVQSLLDRAPLGRFDHHLGHGVGLFPHEAPHLNPHWDDVFEEGDVFTVEPGLYAPQLRAGIRVENNYRVTETGVELLSDFSMAL